MISLRMVIIVSCDVELRVIDCFNGCFLVVIDLVECCISRVLSKFSSNLRFKNILIVR